MACKGRKGSYEKLKNTVVTSGCGMLTRIHFMTEMRYPSSVTEYVLIEGQL